MTNRLHITPDRKNKKDHLEWPRTPGETEVDGDREPSESSMGDDICSPCDRTSSTEYDGESLDFGDSGANLI
ncbi:MAG: hypothetical protein QNK19_03160 [Xanthomonadales bacterium]|nr:hypothetical protein [Xanthomonadales bacterium]